MFSPRRFFGKLIHLRLRRWARIGKRCALFALAVGLTWLSWPWLVSLAYNNYGSLCLNRALLASRNSRAGQADPSASSTQTLASAGTAFQSALAWAPGNGMAYYSLGTIYSTWGQPQAAMQAFSRAAAELPWDTSAHFQLGLSYEAVGHRDLAAREWREARAASFFITRSYAQRASGDYPGARHSLEIALQLEPNLPEAHYALGRLYADEGQTDEAILAYQAGLVLDHKLVRRLTMQAEIAESRKDWRAALSYYEQASESEPGNPALIVRIGRAYAGLGRTEQAAAYYRQAIQLDRTQALPYLYMISLYCQVKDCSLARDYLEQAMAADQTGEFWAGLGADVALCYLKANQPAQAIPLLERAIAREPQAIQYRLTLAQAYAAGGQFQDAIREYRSVLKLDPGNVRAKAGLQSLNASEK